MLATESQPLPIRELGRKIGDPLRVGVLSGSFAELARELGNEIFVKAS